MPINTDFEQPLPPEMQAELLTQDALTQRITAEDIKQATDILQKYKSGKANLEARIVQDELWWELRHWEAIGRKKQRRDELGQPIKSDPEPSSAWLFNSIANKHADAMDNYPEPVCLPRERSDEESAKTLSEILPVILDYNDFEQTYSDAWWEKLKHGTAVYGIFWNNELENGLGDIDIHSIDLLNIFWEPGVTDIQKSRNLFVVELADNDILEDQYPQLKGKLGGSPSGIDVTKYLYDDNVDTADKSVVVDWYYKTRSLSGAKTVHYCKFVGDTLLYASENDPNYRDRGFYDHGLYPFVFDVLFPEKGTPVGFGYVSICKDPQLYIDKLFGNILDYSLKATHPRHFVSANTGVNETEYLDWEKPLVHVEGASLDDTRIRQITLDPLPSIYTSILQMKIEEMKDTSANRDVNSGGPTGGVTAASAIAALQEAGNKVSRDMIAATYRATTEVASQCIELIRQFYDETRSFRITGTAPGTYDFIDVNNAALQDQPVGQAMDGSTLFRRPVFDIKVSAQKKNPFSRMEQNERAKELYGLGFFNPERAQEALGALEMMDFEAIDKVKEQVTQGQTLLNICQQLTQQVQQLTQLLSAATGAQIPGAAPMGAPSGGAGQPGPVAVPQGDSTAAEIMQANTPMTGYGQRLAARSSPNMEGR